MDRRSVKTQLGNANGFRVYADKLITLAAMDALIDPGLANWTMSRRGLTRLRLTSGEIFQLEAERVRRIR